MKREQITPYLVALALGFMLAWIIKPKEKADTTKQDLQNQITILQSENKIEKFKANEFKRLQKLHDAKTQTDVDSIWVTFGF